MLGIFILRSWTIIGHFLTTRTYPNDYDESIDILGKTVLHVAEMMNFLRFGAGISMISENNSGTTLRKNEFDQWLSLKLKYSPFKFSEELSNRAALS